uniref:Uncharacterized protein n=1 Tax=Meloidogyne enterolobii TaxID=390850 RepID=A0A6V7VBW6_MELEN|nr:unnamed protein product [Meloidogyne enterolobii]
MFVRVDSIIDEDLEYCISVGIGELNFLYYLINIKKMVAKEEFNMVIFNINVKIYSLNYEKINHFICTNSVMSLHRY